MIMVKKILLGIALTLVVLIAAGWIAGREFENSFKDEALAMLNASNPQGELVSKEMLSTLPEPV